MLKKIAERLKTRRARRPNPLGRDPLAASPLAYAASHAARTAWFAGHYALAARLTPPQDGAPPTGRIPGWGAIIRDLAALYRRDWNNIRPASTGCRRTSCPTPAWR